jgi:hypothetical protein
MSEDDFHVVDDEPRDGVPQEDEPRHEEIAPAAAPWPQPALDSLRIRHLAAERPAIFRQRSYCVIFAGFCAVAVFELAWAALREARAAGWNGKAKLFVSGALFAAVGAMFIARQAVKLHRQTKRSVVPEPATSPDFSPLSDGSQRWKNLEEI